MPLLMRHGNHICVSQTVTNQGRDGRAQTRPVVINSARLANKLQKYFLLCEKVIQRVLNIRSGRFEDSWRPQLARTFRFDVFDQPATHESGLVSRWRRSSESPASSGQRCDEVRIESARSCRQMLETLRDAPLVGRRLPVKLSLIQSVDDAPRFGRVKLRLRDDCVDQVFGFKKLLHCELRL